MPAPRPYVFLHHVVFPRIIFFHPGILDRTLEIEDVIGILVKELEVHVESIPDIFPDCGLNIPVPAPARRP